jgi:hypothetical protein
MARTHSPRLTNSRAIVIEDCRCFSRMASHIDEQPTDVTPTTTTNSIEARGRRRRARRQGAARVDVCMTAILSILRAVN